jgi:hypothetical protein
VDRREHIDQTNLLQLSRYLFDHQHRPAAVRRPL